MGGGASVLMTIFMVTMRDGDNTRGWVDPETGAPTDEMSWTVDAAKSDDAKEFAEQQNPGLEAIDCKEVK
jgi:hypothetical protein